MNTNCLESKGNGCTLDYFEKNAYFHGKLMTARDMLAEQVMHEGKLYTVNRFMLGDGLVCGLETDNLRVENGKLLVDIKPGMGIDCCGRLIVVKGTGTVVTKEVKQIEDENESGYPEPMYLYIRYKECMKETVPVPGVGDACEEKCCYNRILEVFDVVYSSNPPVQSIPHDVNFPSESDYENDNDNNKAVLKIARDYYNANLKSGCSDCTESLILLGAFTKKQNGEGWNLDETTTTDYLKVAYTNTMLYDIITSHATRFDNPHNVNAEDTGALLSINNVANDEGNIDLITDPGSSITISPDASNNSIMIGEDHSARNDNPHDVKPKQIGAIASINNVESGTSNINLLSPDTSLSITPGIESINLSLSSALQDKILYLEDQVKSMQRYLMDKSLKYKVKAFSEVKDRFGSMSADKIVVLVKEALDNRIYTKPDEYLEVLNKLVEVEEAVSKEIIEKVTEKSYKKYVLSLEDLKKAIKIGNISQAAVAQDEVCEMAEWLESIDLVVVPSVVEMHIDQARKFVIDSGLAVGQVTEKFGDLESGTVIDQYPRGGTEVRVGSSIDLIIVKKSIVELVPLTTFEENDLIVEGGLCEDGEKNCMSQDTSQGTISGGGFFSRFGDKVSLNGNPNKLVDLILEQRGDSWYTEIGGDVYENHTWLFGDSLTLTVEQIDIQNPDSGLESKAKIILKHNDRVLDSKEIQIGELYTYVEKEIEGESNVPMLVTYCDNLLDIAEVNKMVRLKFTWVISRDVTTKLLP